MISATDLYIMEERCVRHAPDRTVSSAACPMSVRRMGYKLYTKDIFEFMGSNSGKKTD